MILGLVATGILFLVVGALRNLANPDEHFPEFYR